MPENTKPETLKFNVALNLTPKQKRDLKVLELDYQEADPEFKLSKYLTEVVVGLLAQKSAQRAAE